MFFFFVNHKYEMFGKKEKNKENKEKGSSDSITGSTMT